MKKAASTPESGKTLPVPSKGRKGGDPGGGDNGNRIRSPRNNNKGETQAAGPGDAGSGGEKQCYI